MNASNVLPTLPAFPACDLSADRTALLAGLAFIEGATGWTAVDISGWFQAYARELGRGAPPPSVIDPALGAASLTLPTVCKPRRPDQLSRLLAMSRWQAIMTLRGLLSSPCDDRFLNAAIFSGRVRRDAGRWQLDARDGDSLSDIVLGLFAVDVLAHREFHQQNLCVCDVCGRISYNPAATTRAGCADHVPGSEAASGVKSRGGR